jgi:hypothetical protein
MIQLEMGKISLPLKFFLFASAILLLLFPTSSFASTNNPNWSGYVAQRGKFTSVNGAWNVPKLKEGLNGADSTWVGIGGANDETLIQAGTEAVNLDNFVGYAPWYEIIPAEQKPIPLIVNPGDSVSVSLNQQSPSKWKISFKNNTTGRSYITTVPYKSSLSSAEWIEETPAFSLTDPSAISPLDNFGNVRFTNAKATKNGSLMTARDAGAKPFNIENQSGVVLTSTSPFGGDGSSFTITRTNTNFASPRHNH